MTDIYLAQILILFLQIPVLYRPFAKQRSHTQYIKDVYSLLPYISLFIIILSIFAFSLQISLALLFLLNLLSCFLNLPRALSFISGMQKDFFSISFKVISALLLVLSTMFFVFLTIYKPSPNVMTDLVATKTTYYGSHQGGFFERQGFFRGISAEQIEIYPSEITQTIIAIPDYCFDLEDMYAASISLAEKGYKLVLFDFFAKDKGPFPRLSQKKLVKNFYEKMRLLFFPASYKTKKPELIEQKKRELLSAISILYSNEPEKVFIITEGLSFEAALSLQEEYPFVIEGVFSTDEKGLGKKALFEDKTFSAFSSFASTKPLDAKLLGIESIDSSIDTIETYTTKVDNFIQNTIKQASIEEAIIKEMEMNEENLQEEEGDSF